MKKEYEMVFIVKPIEKKQFEVAIQKIENIITDNGDDIKVTERWGKKHIAYQINGFNEGLFAFIVFQAEDKTVKNLEKMINHTDEIIQHMIIKMKKYYEIMYIVKPIEEDAFKEVVAKFDKLITENGGKVEKTDCWGKRRLAYEIQDLKEGLYVLVTFQAEAAAVRELDRVMKITDEVLRHMIISKD